MVAKETVSPNNHVCTVSFRLNLLQVPMMTKTLTGLYQVIVVNETKHVFNYCQNHSLINLL